MAVAAWPPVWGVWPSSNGDVQSMCVLATDISTVKYVSSSVSGHRHSSGKFTMFTQCCSTSGVPQTRDCNQHGKTYTEALAFCEAKSQRLCTATELLGAYSKGCNMDGADNRAWSSDTCSGSSMVRIAFSLRQWFTLLPCLLLC